MPVFVIDHEPARWAQQGSFALVRALFEETHHMTKRKLIYLLVLALFVAGCASDPAEPSGSVESAVVVYRPPT